ncbi:hypothetical protein WEI85_22385 [Actinomycetes bacterium KLBMP 9797]
MLALAVATALAGPAATPVSAGAAAATYYVDPTAGNDANAGTSTGAAWRTLGKVSGYAFQPGDVVRFKRGGSWSGTLTLARSGAAGSPITVDAYGSGALPLIGGTVTNCVTVSGSYWVINNIRASGCNWAGFEFHGHHNLVDSVQADNNVVGVSIVDTSHHNTVRWSRLVDNNKMVEGTNGDDDDSGAFGVLLNGDDNLISRNVISGSFAVSDDYGFDGAAVEIYNGDRNRIEYNTTSDNESFTELGHEQGATADDNVFAYNSVTSSKPQAAFLVTRGAGDGLGPVNGTIVDNNSVYLPTANSEGWVCYAGCSPQILRLRNNVIKVGGKTGYEDGAGADEDNGVYSGAVTQFTLGADSVLAEPRFTSATDLHLTSGSPAIGRGEYLGYAYDLDGDVLPTTGIDAGAYQH